ncbi:M48 family metallopeptidase [Phaeodactylibacter xiamenensis]|jgi:predicted Zn-dependent protease|uniref:M48 family metallopeptidase n=1 Tax=Phaeodactylibacter xiamenensis TaxID=1524460 RepID=UPI0024A7E9F4|nr:M48 family metallopeptidase [Phaeodactylibacter xiamenensis]
MNHSPFLFLSICVGILSCNAQPSEHIEYTFPQKTIITQFSNNCLEEPEDLIINLFGQIDRGLLSMYNVTSAEEKELGKMLHESFEHKYVEDSRTKRLRKILSKLSSYVERQELDYRIYLIESEEVNAFTIPGGYIYFTTAMYEFAQNDDEIANIIGHEIGHGENKHTIQSLQRYKQQRDIASVTGLDPSMLIQLYQLATIAYNQPQEIESDYSGFYLAYKAGYKPLNGLEFWRRLAVEESPTKLGKLFRSHPYSETRYQCGLDYIKNSEIGR